MQAPLTHGTLPWLRFAGLEAAMHLEGEAGALEALRPHLAAPGRRTPQHTLLLRCLPGPPPRFDHLSLEERGGLLHAEGDGLQGTLSPGEARLTVHGGVPALLAALRLCGAQWLSERGGLLLHGACCEVDGAALAFLGPSGAGKTTLTRRLQQAGARAISDEVCAVLPRGEGHAVHGHPFPRRLGDGLTPPEGIALAALAFLAHAPAGSGPVVRRLLPQEAARALLARVFLPHRSPRTVAAALDACERLSRTPAFALELPDDARAAQAALSLVRSSSRRAASQPAAVRS
jgi:hypothetical protein